MKSFFYKLVFLWLLFPVVAFSKTEASKKKVVAGTANITVIVREIANDKVDVFCPVFPGMCPGHFDVRSQDISYMANADLLIRQGFEKWTNDIFHIIKNEKLEQLTVPVKNNWMIPETHMQASEIIKQKLIDIDPANLSIYEKNFDNYIARIQKLIKNVEKLDNINVICSLMQKPFLEWMGCKVVASYGRPDSFTSSEMVRIIKKSKKENVVLVVDNLQSGPDAGKTIAQEIGAVNITLTNFPMNDSYIDSFMDNVRKLCKALEK